MFALGSGITFLGYTVFYYGLCQASNKKKVGFLDVLVPGRYKATLTKGDKQKSSSGTTWKKVILGPTIGGLV